VIQQKKLLYARSPGALPEAVLGERSKR